MDEIKYVYCIRQYFEVTVSDCVPTLTPVIILHIRLQFR